MVVWLFLFDNLGAKLECLISLAEGGKLEDIEPNREGR